MFWTLTDETETLMLCERHALSATNEACAIFGMDAFETMAEATVILDALGTMLGGGPMGFGSSEVGHCSACQHELEEFAAEGKTA
jgi:hypothetical protein